MKPLQHARISQKRYGGDWQDYLEIHTFPDLSKAACAHFKHRFLLHHMEGIELGMLIFGRQIVNSGGQSIATRKILQDHMVEDLGRIFTVQDWAEVLLPKSTDPFYQFLAKKRQQIESNAVNGEKELFDSFGLSAADRAAVKDFLNYPLKNSTHPAALLFSHNSFAIFLAERVLGPAFVKNKAAGSQLVPVREILERLVFLRLRSIYSPAEIIARTKAADWMRGTEIRDSTERKRSGE